MSRAKSVFAGKPLFDMSQMMCSPEMRKEFAKAKTTGYLTGLATKKNRWGIVRVDLDASSCLQSYPCQHQGVLWLSNGKFVHAHTSCASELYVVAMLIGAKFDKKGEEHLSSYAKHFGELEAKVSAALDKQFAKKSSEPKEKVSSSSTESKKRSVSETEPVQKKRTVDSKPTKEK